MKAISPETFVKSIAPGWTSDALMAIIADLESACGGGMLTWGHDIVVDSGTVPDGPVPIDSPPDPNPEELDPEYLAAREWWNRVGILLGHRWATRKKAEDDERRKQGKPPEPIT